MLNVNFIILFFLIISLQAFTVYLDNRCNIFDFFIKIKRGKIATAYTNRGIYLTISRAIFFIVESDKIKKYFSQYTDMPIKVIPYKFFNQRLHIENKNKSIVSIVIPGVVDLDRKNLKIFIDALEMIQPAKRKKIQIIFLGNANSSLDQCKKWKKKFANSFVYFEGFVPAEVFERYMINANLIGSSLVLDHQCRYLNEVYGTSKGSGVFGQSISYGKPLLVNTGFEVPSMIESSSVFFSNASDLSSIYNKLIQDDCFISEISDLAIENSSFFTIDEISNRFNI